ncbi:MAG: hypothetical protein WAT79_02670 [Saprospiraceae bacterium]
MGIQSHAQSCETANLLHYQYQDIKNILENNKCQNCHFNGNSSKLWHFDTYKAMTALGQCGPIVQAGSPSASLLVDKLNEGSTLCGYNMPLGAEAISSRDLLAIETWILVGAPEFCIPTFDEVKQILQINQCQSCHQNTGEWKFNTHQTLFQKPSQSNCPQPIVVPFDHQQSFLYQKIVGESGLCGQKMPFDGPEMPYVDIARIRDWINSGAFQSSPSLPVVLTDFSADYTEDNVVLLFWQSANEYNTAYYEVEHSPDGVHFQTIGVRSASGHSSQLTNYEFNDYSPGFGNQYYRLKMIDHDGQFSYSSTRAVRIKNSAETLKIYPSAIQSEQTIYIEWLPSLEEERAKIQFLDIMGRSVFSHIISPGINSVNIPHVLPGLYYAVIQRDVENYFIKKMVMIH